MRIILLIRHGETDWNRSGRVMGDQPIPLNQTGEEQARTCAAILSRTPIAAIYTSPVLRATQTAEILRGPHAVPLHQAAGLSEIGVGMWLNRYWHEFADDPAKREWYTHPDGPGLPAEKRCARCNSARSRQWNRPSPQPTTPP